MGQKEAKRKYTNLNPRTHRQHHFFPVCACCTAVVCSYTPSQPSRTPDAPRLWALSQLTTTILSLPPPTITLQVFGGVHNYKTKMCEVYERLSGVCVQVRGKREREGQREREREKTDDTGNTDKREAHN